MNLNETAKDQTKLNPKMKPLKSPKKSNNGTMKIVYSNNATTRGEKERKASVVE